MKVYNWLKRISVFLLAFIPQFNKSEANNANQAFNLYKKAIKYIEKGSFYKAIKFYDKAISLEPSWGEPIFQKASAYLYIGDTFKALECYKKVRGVYPEGYHITDTAIWSLERELSSTLPNSTFISFIIAQDWEDVSQKQEMFKQLLIRAPNYPPALVSHANLIKDDDERLEIFNSVIKSEHDDLTHKKVILNKAFILNLKDKKAEALKLLEEFINNSAITSKVYKAEVRFFQAFLNGEITELSHRILDSPSKIHYHVKKLPNDEYQIEFSGLAT